jgi:hypothetical protein
MPETPPSDTSIIVAGNALTMFVRTGTELPVTSIRILTRACYGASLRAGGWTDLQTGEMLPPNVGQKLMLVVSEIAEAMEGHRKGLQDDKLPNRPMVEVELADACIRIFDLAGRLDLDLTACPSLLWRAWRDDPDLRDVPTRLLRICGRCSSAHDTAEARGPHHEFFIEHLVVLLRLIIVLANDMNLDLAGAIAAKLAYNATRADHKPENRTLVGGKKY